MERRALREELRSLRESASFHRRMVDLTRFLVVESCADVGYTQSDEISLAVASSL